MTQELDDPVCHPKHYTFGGIETIDFIEAKQLNYNLGNVVKYVSRSGRKSIATTVQDLEKARFYLNREIDRLHRVNHETATGTSTGRESGDQDSA